jgi:hypothetical protein
MSTNSEDQESMKNSVTNKSLASDLISMNLVTPGTNLNPSGSGNKEQTEIPIDAKKYAVKIIR